MAHHDAVLDGDARVLGELCVEGDLEAVSHVVVLVPNDVFVEPFLFLLQSLSHVLVEGQRLLHHLLLQPAPEQWLI